MQNLGSLPPEESQLRQRCATQPELSPNAAGRIATAIRPDVTPLADFARTFYCCGWFSV